MIAVTYVGRDIENEFAVLCIPYEEAFMNVTGPEDHFAAYVFCHAVLVVGTRL